MEPDDTRRHSAHDAWFALFTVAYRSLEIIEISTPYDSAIAANVSPQHAA
jgi:hypothetical protein